MGDVTLWVEENETQSVWNMLSAMVVLGVPVKVKPALVIDADEETAHLLRKCLEASGLRLLVDQDLLLADEDVIQQHEALSRLGDVLDEANDRQAAAKNEVRGFLGEAFAKISDKAEGIISEAVKKVVEVDFAVEPDQTIVSGVERSEDINGVVTYQPVDFEKKPVGEPVIVVLEKEAAPVCEVCGGALYGRRKSAKVCSSEVCQKAFARKYAREYYQKHHSKNAGLDVEQQAETVVTGETGKREDAAEPALSVAEENAKRAKEAVRHAFPWKVLDGERAGKFVSARVMASLLDRKKVKPGWRVEHVENGLFVVAKRQNGSGAECVYELEPSHE